MPEAARPLVLVTRPREESEELARRLGALGYDTLVEPLLDIVPRAVELPPLELYTGLVFTSANGARAFAKLSPTRRLPSYAVGAATATALHGLGFQDVRTGPGEADGLAALIAREQPAGTRFLHLSGTTIARDIAGSLAHAGIQVDRLALYEAVPSMRFSPAFVTALYACTVRVVLFFSGRTAETFGIVAGQMAVTERCCSMAALCLSQRVADKAAALPWARIAVAPEPTEDALLSLLPAPPPIGRNNG
ncbi:MAG TPA: uroporphyrinogen-III synthase [Alphaproteobacteria bacterium]|nr:uroporphyrinogen-III synthase [Alphaproteobacteria bacterium]